MNKKDFKKFKEALPEKYHQLPDNILLAMFKSIQKYKDVYKSLSEK